MIYCSKLLLAYLSKLFGKTKLRTTASKKTTATQLSAKTVRTISGKMANMPVAWVKPRPTLSERLTMTMLRCENPLRAIIPKPAKRMLPNIMIVQPPKTA